jgi:translation initiation factor IF-3
MDYGKFQYMQQKQDSKQKAKSKTSELKEIRMGIKIDQHDLAVKIEKIKKFLDKGDQVKITIILKGREMMFRDKVEVLIDKIKNESQAILEKPLEKLGNRFSVILRK